MVILKSYIQNLNRVYLMEIPLFHVSFDLSYLDEGFSRWENIIFSPNKEC